LGKRPNVAATSGAKSATQCKRRSAIIVMAAGYLCVAHGREAKLSQRCGRPRRSAEVDPVIPIKMLCTLGLRGLLEEVAPLLEQRGLDFAADYGATNLMLPRIAAGETADVAILTDSAIAELVERGALAAGSRRDLARSAIGIAVPAGAPKPDISSVEAFKRALLAARWIGFSKSGASGLHFAQLIVRLGIADEVTRRARVLDGVVGELAAKRQVDIAVQQISELKLVKGIDIVGELPKDLQKVTVFSAGVFAASPRPAAAGLFVSALAAPGVAAVMRSQGLEPMAAVG
jgi:molybdate transport system substrate-binding protein